jgi:hypothetical protein
MLIKLALVRETSSLERAVIQAQDAGRSMLRAGFWALSPIEQVFAKPSAKARWELRFTH